MLISKQGSLWDYLNENPKHIDNFVAHSYNRSISEIILKLLIIEGSDKGQEEANQQHDEY